MMDYNKRYATLKSGKTHIYNVNNFYSNLIIGVAFYLDDKPVTEVNGSLSIVGRFDKDSEPAIIGGLDFALETNKRFDNAYDVVTVTINELIGADSVKVTLIQNNNAATGGGGDGANAIEVFSDDGSVSQVGESTLVGKKIRVKLKATGSKGDKGDTGPQGVAGAKGDTGAQGPEGKTGATGQQGATGAAGKDGATGAKGDIGLGYAGLTSVTSVKIATGSTIFTTNLSATATAFAVGARIRTASKATPANYMDGVITAFSGNTLTVLVDITSGTGTFSDWAFSIGAVKMTIPVLFNSPTHILLSANDCISQKIEFKSISGSTQSTQQALVCKSDGLITLDQTFPASMIAGQTIVYRGRVSIYNLDAITKSNYYVNIQVIGVLAGSGQWVNLGEGSQGVLLKDKNVANEVSFSGEYPMVGGGTICQIGVRLQLLYGQADATAFINTLYLEGNIYEANGAKLEVASNDDLIGDIDAWQIGSSCIIPQSITDLILAEKIKLLDNHDGIAAEVNQQVIKTGDWIMLNGDEIIILSNQKFITQFKPARLGGYYEN